MCALDYLGCLNEETKEKLIGLCMDRNLLISEDETLSGETDEDKYEEGGEEEEEEKGEEMILCWFICKIYY